MSRETWPLHLHLMDRLYRHGFFLYRPLYFAFKRRSDRKIITFIRNHVGPGMTAMDIGANIGFYTLLLSELVGPRGMVHAFEPEPCNFGHLAELTTGRPNVVANQQAVGARDGVATLYLSEDLNVDHRLYSVADARKETAMEIPCVKIDSYFPRGEMVNFVKIDTQGFDFNVLSGMQETVRRSREIFMLSEFWPYGLVKAGSHPQQFLALFRSLGMRVELLDGSSPERYLSRTDDYRWFSEVVAFK